MPDGSLKIRDAKSGKVKTIRYTGARPSDEEIADIADQVFGSEAAPVSKEAAPVFRQAPMAKLAGGGSLSLELLGADQDTADPGVLAAQRLRRELEAKGLASGPPDGLGSPDDPAREFDLSYVRGYRPASPVLRRFQTGAARAVTGAITGPFDLARVLGDVIAASSGTSGSLADTRKMAGSGLRLVDSVVPFSVPLRAAGRGWEDTADTEYTPSQRGGEALRLFRSALGREWEQDPVSVLLQGATLAGGALAGARARLGTLRPSGSVVRPSGVSLAPPASLGLPPVAERGIGPSRSVFRISDAMPGARPRVFGSLPEFLALPSDLPVSPGELPPASALDSLALSDLARKAKGDGPGKWPDRAELARAFTEEANGRDHRSRVLARLQSAASRTPEPAPTAPYRPTAPPPPWAGEEAFAAWLEHEEAAAGGPLFVPRDAATGLPASPSRFRAGSGLAPGRGWSPDMLLDDMESTPLPREPGPVHLTEQELSDAIFLRKRQEERAAVSGSLPLDLEPEVFPEPATAGPGAAGPPSRASAALRVVLEGLGLPRAVLASGDLSAPGRQGAALAPYMWARNPKGYAAAWRDMLQSAKPGPRVGGSGEANYLSAVEALRKHPDFDTAKRSGLELSIYSGDDRGVSSLGQKLPGGGMSQRGYDAFMDRLRLEAFSTMREAMGRDANPKALADVAGFVNRATGRGNLGALGRSDTAAGRALGPVLQNGLFSPKNTAAKFQYLNPSQYLRMAPAARREVLRAQLAHVGAVGAVLGLSAAAGGEVELDPTSADFGKIKLGNTRYEATGGYSPAIRFLARSAALLHEEGKPEDKAQETARLALQFTRNVAAPGPGAVSDVLAPQFAPPGQKDKAAAERLARLFVPLFVQDLYDLTHEEGAAGAVKVIPAGLGVGVQQYAPRSPRGISSRYER